MSGESGNVSARLILDSLDDFFEQRSLYLNPIYIRGVRECFIFLIRDSMDDYYCSITSFISKANIRNIPEYNLEIHLLPFAA